MLRVLFLVCLGLWAGRAHKNCSDHEDTIVACADLPGLCDEPMLSHLLCPNFCGRCEYYQEWHDLLEKDRVPCDDVAPRHICEDYKNTDDKCQSPLAQKLCAKTCQHKPMECRNHVSIDCSGLPFICDHSAGVLLCPTFCGLCEADAILQEEKEDLCHPRCEDEALQFDCHRQDACNSALAPVFCRKTCDFCDLLVPRTTASTSPVHSTSGTSTAASTTPSTTITTPTTTTTTPTTTTTTPTTTTTTPTTTTTTPTTTTTTPTTTTTTPTTTTTTPTTTTTTPTTTTTTPTTTTTTPTTTTTTPTTTTTTPTTTTTTPTTTTTTPTTTTTTPTTTTASTTTTTTPTTTTTTPTTTTTTPTTTTTTPTTTTTTPTTTTTTPTTTTTTPTTTTTTPTTTTTTPTTTTTTPTTTTTTPTTTTTTPTTTTTTPTTTTTTPTTTTTTPTTPATTTTAPTAKPVPPSTCQVCGDASNDFLCTDLDLILQTTMPCEASTPYCMNDISQTTVNGQTTVTIHKRCVDENVCQKLWYEGTSDVALCLNFAPNLSTDDLDCHLCCHGDQCNVPDVPPRNTWFHPSS